MRKEIKQRLFDKVTNHLLTQMKQALSYGECSYRTNDNTKCAIGCLIPDSIYSSEMEHNDFEMLVQDNADAGRYFEHKCRVNQLSQEDIDFFMGLQWIHDKISISEWKSNLQKFAKQHDLKFNWKGGRVRLIAPNC